MSNKTFNKQLCPKGVPMLRHKLSACTLTALLILLTSLYVTSAFAQEIAELYGVYPGRGHLDTEMSLLLSGDGFEGLGELRGVFISGREIPVLDYALISDQFFRVLIFIPARTPTGGKEISFLFDNWGVDA